MIALRTASVLRREIRRKFREVGIGGAIKLGVRKLIRELCQFASSKKQYLDSFDLKYGTDTSGIIKPGALDIPDDKVVHAVQYQTAIVDVFLDILNSLSISYEEFFFVDMGSGKGRALLLASHYPFKGIIGVEFSENLHKIASSNISIYKDKLQQCHRIQSVCEDVADFETPKEKIVFYLFNPFDDHVVRSVLSNIEDSIRRYFRDIYIAYLKPVHRDVFDRATFFQIVKETERYVIYKNKPFELL
jgi:SAM-dependent methyltransferase